MAHLNLARVYQEFDARCGQEADKLRSNRTCEKTLFIPTIESGEQARRRLEDLLREASLLPDPDPVCRLMKNHFTEFLQGRMSSLKTSFDRPGSFVGSLTGYTDFISRKDSRPPAERAQLLLTRLAQADDLWSGLRTLFAATDTDRLKEIKEACEILAKSAQIARTRVTDAFQGLPDGTLNDIEESLNAVSRKAALWAAETGHRLEARRSADGSGFLRAPRSEYRLEERSTDFSPRDTGAGDAGSKETACNPDRYRRILEEELGVDLDRLLDWFEDEVARNRSETLEYASRLNLGARPSPSTMEDVVSVLNEYAGPCASAHEMFERFRAYVNRARQAAKSYAHLPEESVQVEPVAEQYRVHYPWGGYGGGCPRRRPLVGEVFLNDTNMSAVTDGWLKMMAIHECYPGHHVQFVRGVVDPLPETVKMGARSVPLTEGTAHRSERLFEFVFPEDRFYPLFVSYRRLHTAVRIKADLYLQHFGRPIGEIVDLYVSELGFDRRPAQGQVKAQELMVGYFTAYYYGLKRVLDLESQYSCDAKAFTNLLFSVGRVSLNTLEEFLKLSGPDKERFLTGLPSLLKYS